MSEPPTLTSRILEGSVGRDRVLDFVKVAALALVVIGHQVAWTTFPDGTASNTLDVAPSLWWMSWALQWLPVFFFAAGVGLRSSRDAGRPWADVVRSRATSLLAAALPLIFVSLVLTALIAAWRPSLAQAAGVITVQLLWFVGVYILVVLVSPVILRLHAMWWVLVLIVLVVAIDLLRIHVDDRWGWLNLIVVWSVFALVGAQRDRWAKLPRIVLTGYAVFALAGSALALVVGPYSKALITANAAPGLSNLAPPTIVLCLFGVAQILVILLAWRALARWLDRDRVWVPVAIAGSRSMGIYIWHMLVTSIVIAVLVLAGIAPPALSLTWWLLHGGSLVVVVAVSWFIAGPAQLLSRSMATRLAHTPWRFSAPVVGLAALLAAASVLGISESGLYPFIEFRWVAGVLPYFPLIAIALVVCGLVVSAGRGRPRPERGTGP
jgi:hypothetical protein